MNEKGFILGFSSRAKVVCRARRRNPHVTQDGSREMLTVLDGVSALGHCLPPFVIYKGKGHYMGWHLDTDDPKAKFAYSPNGWTDDELGFRWLSEHFEPHTVSSRPRLLILNGHGSHINWKFCQFALIHNIHIMCLPAHFTHLLQPLVVGVFGPLQHYYGKAADDHMRDTRTGIKKGTFWRFYRDARRQTFIPKTIQSAFRTTGVWPFNPNKVPNKVFSVTRVEQPDMPHAIFQTPRNRHQLRKQTAAAIKFAYQPPSLASSATKAKAYLSVILRLTDLAERALTAAEIAKIETQRLQEGYEGKKAAKADRRVLSKARIITGADVIRLRAEYLSRDEKRQKKKKNPTKKTPSTPIITPEVIPLSSRIC